MEDWTKIHYGTICADLLISIIIAYGIFRLIRRSMSRFGLRHTNPVGLKIGIKEVMKVRSWGEDEESAYARCIFNH